MEIAKLAPADGLLTTADMPREPRPAPALSPHTRRLLQDPVVPMLLRMAWPNILIMLAQASTGLIETFWVARLGTDALAGMALVFPVVMLMQTISAGAMGGGISAAIARALGRGQRDDADALVLHAVVINVVLGLVFSAIMLAFGRPIFRALGGTGGELEAALLYSNVVFAGNVLLWVMNGLASAIRGTGNMLVPAIVICVGVVFLVPLSPVLIFGWGPLPALGVAGGGTAIVAFYAAGTAVLGWYVLSGRNLARLRRSRLRWPLFRDILRVGAVASLQSVQTNLTIALATALVAGAAGVDAVAGFGTGVRLEYLLIPLVFGLGAPLVALVGTNIGAGQQQRALHIALTGGALAFALTETAGPGRGDLAGPVAVAVQRRAQHDRDRQRVPPHRRTGLRLLWPGPLALLRLAGRGAAVLAAVLRLPAGVHLHRGRLAGPALDRLARVDVRRPGAGPRRVRHVGRPRHPLRRLVPRAMKTMSAREWRSQLTGPDPQPGGMLALTRKRLVGSNFALSSRSRW